MGWLGDRSTVQRVALVGAGLLVAGVLIVLGDPLAHAGAGARDDGTRGLTGVPRIAELAALVVAVVIAMPPRETGD